MALCESILITGASRGIGLEFVHQLVSSDKPPKHLFAACRTPDKATDLQKLVTKNAKCKVHLIQLDVVDDAQIAKAVEEVGKIVGDAGLNMILNNAGVLTWEQLPKVSRRTMLEHFDINTASPVMIAQAFIPLLKQAALKNKDKPLGVARAVIVNMSTGAASISDSSGGGYPYRASKAGLNMVSRCLGLDLKKDDIISVAILPGYVATDMTGNKGNMTATESVQKMLTVIKGFDESHNGGYYSYKGEAFAW